MSESGPEAVTRLLLTHRRALTAYIYAIVRDHGLAEDVLQEVALILLRRWTEFGEIRDFGALTREIARRQSLQALRQKSNAPAPLSAEALDALDTGYSQVGPEADTRLQALKKCMEKLPAAWLQIVRGRYWSAQSVQALAAQLKRSENVISVTLHRIHSRLADCVNREVRGAP